MVYVERYPLVLRPPVTRKPARSRASGLLAAITFPLRVLRRWRDLEQLGAIDEHSLRDIGLTPADIAAARNLPFGKDPTAELARIAEERRAADPTFPIHRQDGALP